MGFTFWTHKTAIFIVTLSVAIIGGILYAAPTRNALLGLAQGKIPLLNQQGKLDPAVLPISSTPINSQTLAGHPGLYYLDAGNLIGTVSTDRFSAYQDLQDEGQIAVGSTIVTDKGGILKDVQGDVGGIRADVKAVQAELAAIKATLNSSSSAAPVLVTGMGGPTSIKAGLGLAGGGSSGEVALAVVAGEGIALINGAITATLGANVDLASSEVVNVLPIAHGGTGLAATPGSGQILVGDGTGYQLTVLTAGAGIGLTNSAGTMTFGNTGVTALTGTAGQIAVSGSTGSIILSLPQDIASSSSPSFSRLYLSGITNQLSLGQGTITWSATTNRTITFPDDSGTVCLTSGNCAGSGSGIVGSGTNGQIAFFTDGNTISSNSGLAWDTATQTLTAANVNVTSAYLVNGSPLTTSNVAEGDGLYYTDARFDARLATKSTSNLAEGGNLYFTQGRFDVAFGNKTTDTLTEGSTNLYLTESRVSANTDVAANTAARHTAATVADSATLDLTIVGQQISGSVIQSGVKTSLITNDAGFVANLSSFTSDDLAEGVTHNYFSDALFAASLATRSTSNLAEGTNLYYTQARFDSAFSNKTTDGLAEGDTNWYFTNSRFTTAWSTKTTSDLAEGTNLYYTDARFDARLALKTTDSLTQGSSHLYSQWQTVTGGINFASGMVGIGTPTPGAALDVTGSGAFSGGLTAATINGLTITNNGTNTLSLAAGKTLTVTNSLSLTGTDGDSFIFPAGGGRLCVTTSGCNASGTISGAGTAGQLAFFDGSNSVSSDGGLVWNNTSKTLSVTGTVVMSGDIVPDTTITRSLGSPTVYWKDVYIGPGSLYINGKKVLEEQSNTIVVGADLNQNLSLQTSGSGDVELNATGAGQIQLKSNVQLTAGKTITSSDGSALALSNGVSAGNLTVAGNSITATNLNGGISFTPIGSGGSYFTSGNVGIGLTSGLNGKLTLAADTTAAGGIYFGSDTNLYRSAATTLKTDNNFLAATVNGLTITNNGANTFTLATGKSFTVSNTVTFNGTDGTTFTLPAISGTLCVTSSGCNAANTMTGSGATGQIAYFDGTNTATGDSGLSWDSAAKSLVVSGSIHIPTQAVGGAVARLSIGSYGTISETANGLAYITGNAIAASPTANNTVVKTNNDTAQFIRMRYDTGISFHTGLGGAVGTTYADDANTRLLIDLSGNIGIGTLSPKNKLDVVGGLAVGSYAGVITAPANGLIVSGNVGIGKNSASVALDVSGAGAFSDALTATSFNGLTITNNGSNTLTITSGKTLTVNNSLGLSGTDGKIFNIGANNLTFTTSADTTLTLPTSGSLLSGSATSGQVAYYNGSSILTGSSVFTFNGTSLLLNNSSSALSVKGATFYDSAYLTGNALTFNMSQRSDWSLTASSGARSQIRFGYDDSWGNNCPSQSQLVLDHDNYSSQLSFCNTSGTGGAHAVFRDNSATVNRAEIYSNAGIQLTATNDITIAGTSNLIIAGGNLGVGTSTPGRSLDVTGAGSIGGLLLAQANNGPLLGRTQVGQSHLAIDENTVGSVWTQRSTNQSWRSVAMSADGRYQTATVENGSLYTSSDYGATWTAKDSSRNWLGVAMSADGRYQTAGIAGGTLYVSSDYGSTWVSKGSSGSYYSIAMSADGRYQTAPSNGGYIYVSTDYGATWTAKDSSRNWYSVALSSDGKYQTAAVNSGNIYTSSDYGSTWVSRGNSGYWGWGLGMSADGRYQTAGRSGGSLYTSSDYGATWAAKGSSLYWTSVAISANGKLQMASASSGGNVYISYDYGATWAAKGSGRTWYGVAMSTDGKYLAAAVYGGYLYTSVADTTLPGGGLTASTFNGLSIVNNGPAALNIASSKTLAVGNSLTFNGTDGTTFTLPSTSGTLCVTSSGCNAANTITGTGTSGQLAVFNGSNSQTSSSDLIWNGNQLDISGASNPGFRVYNQGDNGWYFYNGAGQPGNFGMYDITAGKDRLVIKGDGTIDLGNEYNNPFVRIAADGSVGIGSPTPGATLDVAGTLRASNAVTFSNYTTNGGILTTDGSGNLIQTSAGSGGECLKSTGGSTPTWGTCGGSSLFTDAGTYTYLSATTSNIAFGGNSEATATFDFKASSGMLYLGTDQTLNGGISFYSAGNGLIAPSISANSTGDLVLKAPSATVKVGNGSGNISLSLTNASDAFLADKTATLATGYSGNDFTFTRNLMGGSNLMGGAVLKIIDTSSGSTTINPDLIWGNAALLSGTYTGNLLHLQVAGVDKFTVGSDGGLVAGAINGLTITNTGGATLNIATGKTLAIANSLSFSGTDNDAFTLPSGGGAICVSGGTCTASAVRLDQISSASANSTLVNNNYAIAWNWGSLTTQTGFTLGGGTAMTSGSVFGISSGKYIHTGTQTGSLASLSFSDYSTGASGASITNGLNISAAISTSGAGTKTINGINIAAPTLSGCSTGACTYNGLAVKGGSITGITSYALNVDAGTATGSGLSYAAIFMNGNVGIGTLTPGRALDVVGAGSINNLLIAQIDGGVVLGRTLVAQNQLTADETTIGTTWTAQASTNTWKKVAMSANGKYQTATASSSNIYVSSNYGTTWTAKDSSRNWYGVAMSADGKYQTATVSSGNIYTSVDYGNTWTARDSIRSWNGIAMSADGKYQTAEVNAGNVYTSSDYGVSWTARASSQSWFSVAMSADGKYQTATATNGNIYTSTDYGASWIARDSTRFWGAVAMSADGKYQTAGLITPGSIYTSSDYGVTWTVRPYSAVWYDIAISANGKLQTAAAYSGDKLYTSYDYGATWTARDSNRNWYGVALSSDGKYQTAAANTGYLYTSVANSQLPGGDLALSNGSLVWTGVAAPGLSASGAAKAYFDLTSNTLKLSENGGNYYDVLSAGRPLQSPLITKTTGYTITNADSIVLADTSGGTFAITLPTAVGITGKQFTIKELSSSGFATLATTSSQTIDGSVSYTFSSQYETITVASDGANWVIIGK